MTDPRNKLSVRRFSPLSVITGATYPLRALGLLLTTPKLQGYVLIPILINIVVGATVYAGLLFGGFHLIDVIFANLPHWIPDLHLTWAITLPTWLSWLSQLPIWLGALVDGLAIALDWLLHALLVLTLLLITGFIFLQFGVLLGAPWYGKLSEELEKMQTGQLPPPQEGIGIMIRDVGRAIAYELKKLVITVGIGLPLLLFYLLPGIGTAIATIGGTIVGATIVCLDFLDPAQERRRPRFRDKLGTIVKTLPASATFGLTCFALVSVPFLNLLAIPVCVMAGTLFFCDRVLKDE